MAQFSEQDLIQLNSYLDGRLTSNERAALETRLARDVALRTELESLRDTIGLLRMAERVPVPRSFTLDPVAFARQSRPSLWDRLGLTSIPGWAYAGASLAVMMIIGALLLNGASAGLPAASVAQAPSAADGMRTLSGPEEFAAEMAAAEATEAPAEAATEAALFAAQPESGTPGADAAPTMGPASKIGDETPAAGVGGMGGGMGGPPAGMGGGPAEEPTELPLPTEESAAVAQGATEMPAVGAAGTQTNLDMGSGTDSQAAGARNLANGVATEAATIEVTEAKPFDRLKESSWALLLGGTVLLVVIVLVVTVITRRR